MYHRVGRRNKVEYLVAWKNYDVNDATWEPEQNLENAQKILRNYKQIQFMIASRTIFFYLCFKLMKKFLVHIKMCVSKYIFTDICKPWHVSQNSHIRFSMLVCTDKVI